MQRQLKHMCILLCPAFRYRFFLTTIAIFIIFNIFVLFKQLPSLCTSPGAEATA